MPKRKVLQIGVVSECTLRDEDLLAAYLDAADSLKLDAQERRTVRVIKRADYAVDSIVADIELLLDILSNHVPDWCYFGSHEGDGACIGVWPDSDVPFHSDGNDEIAKGSSLPPVKSIKQFYFLLVNDHGNCTLYRKSGRRWRECWSLV